MNTVLAPEHLEVGDLGFIGHLLGNPLSHIEVGLNAMLVRFATESCLSEPSPEFMDKLKDMRDSRVVLFKGLQYLFDKYGSDIEKIPGLADTLNILKTHLEKGQWDLALDAYSVSAKQFKFGLEK